MKRHVTLAEIFSPLTLDEAQELHARLDRGFQACLGQWATEGIEHGWDNVLSREQCTRNVARMSWQTEQVIRGK